MKPFTRMGHINCGCALELKPEEASMKPFNRISHVRPMPVVEPNPRPFSDAEVMRARLARWLRLCHKAEMTVPDIVARIHGEPSDSDWLPGDDEPKLQRS